MPHTEEQIFAKTKQILIDLFELDEQDIHADALLYEDLDIDSIDTVDLLIELKNFSGKSIAPETFHSCKTLGDIVKVIAEQDQS